MAPLRSISLLLMLTLVATPASAGKDKAQDSSDKAALYSAGAVLARQMAVLELSPAEQKAVIAGFSDAAKGKKLKHNEDLGLVVFERFRARRVAEIQGRKNASSNGYLAEQEAVRGTVRLGSGMLVRTTSPGHGRRPGPRDSVTIHYTGMLRDGTVFDSSHSRGDAPTFPLPRLIPCWQEGLQHMKVGGKATLFCPPDLAYGETGAGDVIPPNAVLQFEIELFETAAP
jgi:FKBP-type peptidyl-prolyl cis-trans isomerase FkpA